MKPAVTTITLLVANILLLGYIFLIDRDRRGTRENDGFDAFISDFEPDEVSRVLISSASGDAEVVKLPDGSWRFAKPFSDRFDPKLMSDLLENSKRLRINDTVSDDEIEKEGWSDADFGLGENAVTLRMMDEAGNELAGFELGGPTPFERTVYARRAGEDADDAVHYIWGDAREIVARPFGEMRDRRLIFAKTDDVWRVKFRPPSAAGLEVHVEKGEDKRWRMEHPPKARADQELVKELVSKLTKLEVAEIVDDPGADVAAAFDDKRYEIVLRQRSKATENAKVTIKFGKLPMDDSDPYVLASVSDREGVVFKVDRRVHYEFGMDGNSLRDKTLADFDYNYISSVRIRRGNQDKVVLKKWGNVWALHNDPQNPAAFVAANGRKVKDFVEMINDAEILKFESDAAVDLEPYGLKEPPMEVTINRQYPDPNAEPVGPGEIPKPIEIKDTLMFGIGAPNDQPGAFAAFRGSNSVYRIGDALPRDINREKALGFRTLQLWPRFTQFDMRKVTVKDKTTDEALELSYDHTSNLWTAIQGGVDVTGEMDKLVLDGYLLYLGRPPRGDDWTESTLSSYKRLEKPELSLKIEVIDPQDQKTPRTIEFEASATIEGGRLYYGRVNGGDDVVVLSSGVIDALRMPIKNLNKK